APARPACSIRSHALLTVPARSRNTGVAWITATLNDALPLLDIMFSLCRTTDDGRWTMDDGRWTTAISRQLSACNAFTFHVSRFTQHSSLIAHRSSLRCRHELGLGRQDQVGAHDTA